MPRTIWVKAPFRTSFFLRDTSGKLMHDSTGQPLISQPWLEYFGQIAVAAAKLEDLEVLQALSRDDFVLPEIQVASPVESSGLDRNKINEVESRIAALEAIPQQFAPSGMSIDSLTESMLSKMESRISEISSLLMVSDWQTKALNDIAEIRSLLAAIDGPIPDASANQRGAVNTIAQIFRGIKGVDGLDFAELDEPDSPVLDRIRVYAVEDADFTVLETKTDLGIINRINQDVFRIARNTTGVQVAAAKAVYFSGSTGNKPNFALARSNAEATMAAVGMTTAIVDDTDFGEIMIIGRLQSVKTDYAGWVEGDQLYVDPSTAGELTNVRPAYPNFPQWVGTIEAVHATAGVILVNIQALTGVESGTNAAGGFTVLEGFGCNGKSAQTEYASGGAAAAVAGTATSGGFGFVSAAEMNDFITAVNAIKTLANNHRLALIANGIES